MDSYSDMKLSRLSERIKAAIFVWAYSFLLTFANTVTLFPVWSPPKSEVAQKRAIQQMSDGSQLTQGSQLMLNIQIACC